MNQMNFDKNRFENERYWRTINRYLTGLGAFLAIALTSVFLLTIVIFMYSLRTQSWIDGLVLLLSSLILLFCYSALTTKTISNNIYYRFPHIIKRFFDIIIS
jgi:hypothetical protein